MGSADCTKFCGLYLKSNWEPLKQWVQFKFALKNHPLIIMRKQANLECGRLHKVAYFSLEIQYYKNGVCGGAGGGVGLDHNNGHPTPPPI